MKEGERLANYSTDIEFLVEPDGLVTIDVSFRMTTTPTTIESMAMPISECCDTLYEDALPHPSILLTALFGRNEQALRELLHNLDVTRQKAQEVQRTRES